MTTNNELKAKDFIVLPSKETPEDAALRAEFENNARISRAFWKSENGVKVLAVIRSRAE